MNAGRNEETLRKKERLDDRGKIKKKREAKKKKMKH